MAVIIDKNKCNGCGLCVSVCPIDAISIVDNKAVVSEQCVMCRACTVQCPQNAIL